MVLRPGSDGSNTFTDHKEVLTDAVNQVPVGFRRKILVRIDGVGASHILVGHLISLSTARKTVLCTCGWTIVDADEQAIAALPASAWEPGLRQDGSTEKDKDTAEITHLMSRAEDRPPETYPQAQPGLALDWRLHRLPEPALRPVRASLTSANDPDDSERRPPAPWKPVPSRACRAAHHDPNQTRRSKTDPTTKRKRSPGSLTH